MDLGRPKNKSSQNQKKPMPLRRSHRTNSDDIFFFQKMDTICKSYRVLIIFPNRKKSQKVNSQQVILLMSKIRQHDVAGEIMMTSVGECGNTRVCHMEIIFGVFRDELDLYGSDMWLYRHLTWQWV
jgi:hypothetical protein